MDNKIIYTILAFAVLIVIAVSVAYIVNSFKVTGPPITPSPITKNPEIISFKIIPSAQEANWLMYEKGAEAILKGKNIAKVEFWSTSTGTQITENALVGYGTKVIITPASDTWSLGLPEGLLTTAFWAVAYAPDGSSIKSIDLGNVGYKQPSQKIMQIKVYFLPKQYYSDDCSVTSETIITIPKTVAVATAAINELLQGPQGSYKAVIESAIPTGTKLLSLHIENGTAYAEFSREIQNYGGDSCNALAIRAQIENTLKQFPTVDRVEISVPGVANPLQP